MRLVLFNKKTLTIKELNLAEFFLFIVDQYNFVLAAEDENGLHPYDLDYNDLRKFGHALCRIARRHVTHAGMREQMRLCLRRTNTVGVLCMENELHPGCEDRARAATFKRAHSAARRLSWQALHEAMVYMNAEVAAEFAVWLFNQITRRCYATENDGR